MNENKHISIDMYVLLAYETQSMFCESLPHLSHKMALSLLK